MVIPVFNQVSLTEHCLESLLANSDVARELIVVDNASTDRTPAVLLAFQVRFAAQGWSFRVLRNEVNQGFGRACNRGIREAHGDFIGVLNNDTWLMPHWDRVLLMRAKALAADMVTPCYDEQPFEGRRTPVKIAAFIRRNRGKTKREWGSILMLFSRQALARVGLFDERFFVTYEDTDLRERMDRAEMRYFKVGDCVIWHHSKGTRGQQPLPKDYELEGLRLFVEKWGFDPRLREHTRGARLRRRWQKIKSKFGLF